MVEFQCYNGNACQLASWNFQDTEVCHGNVACLLIQDYFRYLEKHTFKFLAKTVLACCLQYIFNQTTENSILVTHSFNVY